jgi:hypothetical protein
MDPYLKQPEKLTEYLAYSLFSQGCVTLSEQLNLSEPCSLSAEQRVACACHSSREVSIRVERDRC